MPTRRSPILLALLLLLAAPSAASAQPEAPGVEAALTPHGLQVTLPCLAPPPTGLQVEVGGLPPAVAAPVAAPATPVSLALVVERSAAMAGAGTPYSTRQADVALLTTALLDRAPPGSQVSLLSFDGAAARTLVTPTADPGAVRGALAARAAIPADQEGTRPSAIVTGGGLAAALGLADALLGGGPPGPRAIVVFTAGAVTSGGLPALRSNPRLTFVELGGAGQEATASGGSGAIAGARDVAFIPFHTDDSSALPGLLAAYERRVAELTGGGRVSIVVPVAGLGPGRHELRVSGCGAPQAASFELPAAAPGPALLLAACALPAIGLGYGLWRRGRAAAAPHGGSDTGRYRSPLDVTTARREAGPALRAELCAVVWDGRERQVYSLQARQTTVGREAGCAIRIESEWVSGLHARLSLVGEGVEIVDLESTNGTFIGEPGRLLAPGAPAPLALGETVRIGPDVRLTVCRADGLPPEGLDGAGGGR
jgi:hypothetical protein